MMVSKSFCLVVFGGFSHMSHRIADDLFFLKYSNG